MNQFTASLAAQHRAELMTAAQRTRDYRLAKAARGRQLRLPRFPRPPRPAITFRPTPIADAL